MPDNGNVKREALDLLGHLGELDGGEHLLMPILLDAISIVETYRRVRVHQVAGLPELTRSVDALLRELEVIRRTARWAEEAAAEA